MKEIAKECVRLKKELAKKEAQVKLLSDARAGVSDGGGGKPEGDAKGEGKQQRKSIPGTNRFNFSRTASKTMVTGTGASSTKEVKPKQFEKNPALQRSSVQVMYAAMGLPDEEDR